MKKKVFLFVMFFSYAVVANANSGDVVNHIETNEKLVALTFDADMTPRMLSQLKSGRVKSWNNHEVITELLDTKTPATLFLTGMWIEQYSTTTTLLAENNLFEIANHSYSHPAFEKKCFNLKAVRPDLEKFQIEKTDELLKKYAPGYKKYFRFPGLCFGNESLGIVDSFGYTAIGGDVFGEDGFQRNYKVIVNNVLNKVKPGSIIILHMMGGPNAPETAKALPEIIEKLKNRGYTFVKVSDLISLEKK